MGEVWRARHRVLVRDAAVKLIRPEALGTSGVAGGEALERRFELEAKATAALQSPHTVAVYDYGRAGDGSFYYVMEMLDGVDLEDYIKRFGPMSASRVVHVLRQVCDSLAEAHQGGLIHRDIKPRNVFLCRLGLNFDHAKVLDFRLVKSKYTEETRLTGASRAAARPPGARNGARNTVDSRTDPRMPSAAWPVLLESGFHRRQRGGDGHGHVQAPPAPLDRTERKSRRTGSAGAAMPCQGTSQTAVGGS
jgi:serine/threonine protein kinase